MTTLTKVPNRLINEKSPYLLQHAYNPVDWFPWSDEAFERARREDKPVFLSIGYSTCHWCHVMAHESFEDDDVAELLNRSFVSIKVDREERPDVDAVYMSVCQALTGSGGWPLTIIMTPERQPFFAGTYFRQDYLVALLDNVAAQWQSGRQELITAANKITAAVSQSYASNTESSADEKQQIQRAYASLKQIFDPKHGGFGAAPKFPTPHNLMFLLRYHVLENDATALAMVEKTLTRMMMGGIFDHIGGGFSRYSTDNHWLAPHFEKMLYDNALLTLALTECYIATKDPIYRQCAEKALQYCERELCSPEGAFYSAQDADSDGVEGKYYVFTPTEVKKVLGDTDGEWFCRQYDITAAGNFEGKSIPNLIKNKNSFSIGGKATPMLEKLYTYRLTRTKLHTDDKTLTAWNAMMIAALAKASVAFGEEKHLVSALRALAAVEKFLMPEGKLKTSYRDGKTTGDGLLDDYAYLTWAQLEVYAATLEPKHLLAAQSLAQTAIERFSDKSGGFFISDGNALIFRPKESYDGAMPSGNSVMGYCLTKLAALTGEKRWLDAAQAQAKFLSAATSAHPLHSVFALISAMQSAYPSSELVCTSGSETEKAEILRQLNEKLRPNLSVLHKTPKNSAELAKAAPFTAGYPLPDAVPCAFYLCRNQSCAAPVFDFSELDL